ncbi:hypothetical protein A2773_04090 [Candidatus Gottesmanbacteria bacterium RIFCSPHIGHO2_01_FULL_39_10]|uniref:FCP1 homology domain-containing protein n=1 Tax=Candidatus Gottesmanbacteria bacterium RIFCSPHIGHO2_01_FULL_39_10 TaxID=1798375 RepID=A0A1F5ZRP5_9BACT|nr:MAG: hypothetical protein A2773_04090 [Candidatus Gottesmanbacteria bacterium RIFCSPHIGHO2_01_FULL_39_10]
MVTHLLFDFSRVLLLPKDGNYKGMLNDLYRKIIKTPGYKFFDYFELNKELLKFIGKLKNKYTVSIFTTDIIQKDPALREILNNNFKNIFAANDLGVSKKDPNSYKLIANKLQCSPNEIIYIDDNQKNVEAAKSAGINAIYFMNNQQILFEIKDVFGE